MQERKISTPNQNIFLAKNIKMKSIERLAQENPNKSGERRHEKKVFHSCKLNANGEVKSTIKKVKDEGVRLKTALKIAKRAPSTTTLARNLGLFNK